MPIIICLKNDIKYNDKLKISVFNVFLFVEPEGLFHEPLLSRIANQPVNASHLKLFHSLKPKASFGVSSLITFLSA